VTLSVAVAPLELLATIVNVVCPLTAMVVEPSTATEAPLRVADVALLVCQVTTARFVPCIVASMLAVGAAGVAAPTLNVTSLDAGPY
jgi:hypothetical protein